MSIHKKTIRLASASAARAQLLRNAGLEIESTPARIDEDAVKLALLAEEAKPRDIADALAEAKAIKIGAKHPQDLVIGCDQVLAFEGQILSKPRSADEARAQIAAMRGKTHQLLSAAVLVEDARPIWRHIGIVTLTMHPISDAYLDDYIARNWPAIGDCVGGYMLEAEGVRLFSQIRGDYFTVLGLPLLELLSHLGRSGAIAQ